VRPNRRETEGGDDTGPCRGGVRFPQRRLNPHGSFEPTRDSTFTPSLSPRLHQCRAPQLTDSRVFRFIVASDNTPITFPCEGRGTRRREAVVRRPPGIQSALANLRRGCAPPRQLGCRDVLLSDIDRRCIGQGWQRARYPDGYVDGCTTTGPTSALMDTALRLRRDSSGHPNFASNSSAFSRRYGSVSGRAARSVISLTA